MPLYEDKLMSDTAVDPTTASPLLAQPGIGIAPVQNAAPQQNVAPQQIPMKQDLRSDAISKMGGVQKFLAALGEFGAGYQGKPSPIDTQIAQEQQAKFQKMQEWGMKFDLGKKVHDESLTLTGDTRKAYLEARAKELDILEPNLGNSVRLFADEPGLLDAFQKSMPKMPAAIQTLVKTNPQAFFKFQKDHPAEFIKMVKDAEQQTNLDEASTKLRQFSIPKQFLPEVKGGKLTASQFQKIQASLPEGDPGKLTPENWKAINSSDASQTLFYNSAGIMSPKDEAEVAQKTMEASIPARLTPADKLARERFEFEKSQAGGVDSAGRIDMGLPKPVNVPWASIKEPKARAVMQRQRYTADSKILSEDEVRAKALNDAALDADRFVELNKTVETGTLVDKTPGGKWLASFGEQNAEMQSITAKTAPHMRPIGSGASSDFDAKQYERATLSVEKPKETNEAIAKVIKARAQNEIDYLAFRQSYLEQNGTLEGSKRYWDEYSKNNTIFDQEAPGTLKLNDKRIPWQQYFGEMQQQQKQKTIVNTGTYNGKKVIKYSDGSVEYAD